MISLSGIPFLRFTIAFSSGILFYIFIQPATDFLFPYISSVALYILLFLFGKYKKTYYYYLRPFTGIAALCSLFLFGLLLCQLQDDKNISNHLLNIESKIIATQYRINSTPETKEKTFRIEAETEKTFTVDKIIPATGKVILYISKDKYQNLQYGDVILAKGKPEPVEAPKNPYEFNYKEYLRYKHIYHTQFVKASEYTIQGHNNGNPIISFAFCLRSNAEKVIQKYIPGKTEQSIASALLLGLKGTMDNDLKDIYSTTGTTHVLAVSGLHVAIVFQILIVIFYFLKNSKFQRIILPIILFSSLWIYVMVTGFCPSVLRAGVMLSLIIAGKAINKNINIYNSIFFSAFILLLFDPFMIMDTGFQLSYLALLGIVYFSDKIYHLKEFNNIFADKIWMAISVSLAAQITTLPISLLYFHQVPVLFLIANLIAIPLSTCILYSGAILLITSFIPPLASLAGLITGKLISFMNYLLSLISHIPFVSIKGISINHYQVIIIYLFIIFFSVFLHSRKIKYFFASFLIASTLLISTLFNSYLIKTQKKFIVFNIKNHLAFAFIKGEEAYLIADSALQSQKEKISRHILPCFTKFGIKNYSINKNPDWIKHYQNDKTELFTFNKKSFLLLKVNLTKTQQLPYCSFLISNYNNNLLETIKAGMIVVNSFGKKENGKKFSERIYNLSVRKALEVDL